MRSLLTAISASEWPVKPLTEEHAATSGSQRLDALPDRDPVLIGTPKEGTYAEMRNGKIRHPFSAEEYEQLRNEHQRRFQVDEVATFIQRALSGVAQEALYAGSQPASDLMDDDSIAAADDKRIRERRWSSLRAGPHRRVSAA